ncbi:hypothetical protein [Skermanella stibiiresistens]|nr:hypothetical protein [Skermanella stibiiresistens]
MSTPMIVIALIALYAAYVYNRLQKLWLVVRQDLSEVDLLAGSHVQAFRRLADAGGRLAEHQQMLPQLIEAEKILLARRDRCNASIRLYNTYRSQLPQVLMSGLAGFREIAFLTADPALTAGRPRPEDAGSGTVTVMRR